MPWSTGLVGKDATAALKHLAQAKLDTSAAAMSTSLGKAAGVLAALDQPSQWETVRRGGPDPRRATEPRPRTLLADLKDALTSDEYAVALEPHLDSALTQAIRLLTAEEAPDHADADDPRRPARRVEDDRAGAGSDHAGHLGGPDREAQGPPRRRDGDVRLEIHWSLQKKGPR